MSVALVQPLPGIGDMIWHLAHIRAVAAWAGEPVTLIAKPRSLADQILIGDPAIRDILWVDTNPSGRRGLHDGIDGFFRLTRMLRGGRFDRLIMLHHSHTIAAAAMLAGIPDRRGYGWGRQRWFLNHGPFLPPEVAKLHQHTRATRYLEAAGIPLASAEPSLVPSPDAVNAARARLAGVPRPFVAMGIGASEVSRQFGAAKFAVLARALLDAGWPALVLMGGPDEQGLADQIVTAMGAQAAARTTVAIGWPIGLAAALLRESAFYVGNNTGVMNLAAAADVRTYALFGTCPPFFHASQILAILSPPGPDDGMVRLTVDAVLQAIRGDRGRLGV